VNDAAVFRANVVNPHTQKTLLLYAKVIELRSIGGTDYTTALDQLAIDAQQLEVGGSVDERMAALINLAFVNAGQGTTTYSALQSILGKIVALLPHSDDMLERMDLLVTCKLGVHKSYPQ